MQRTGTATIALHGIGVVPAVPLADVTEGDTLMWNYGVTTAVVSVVPAGAKSVTLTVRNGDGSLTTARKRAATLVARGRDTGVRFEFTA